MLDGQANLGFSCFGRWSKSTCSVSKIGWNMYERWKERKKESWGRGKGGDGNNKESRNSQVDIYMYGMWIPKNAFVFLSACFVVTDQTLSLFLQ